MYYHILTYGCQMNEHESEKLAGVLDRMGFLSTQQTETADLILFNTCCVRDHAEQKTFGNIGAIKHLKEENPRLIVAVCGCMTQQKNVALKMKRIYPFIDIIFGTHNIGAFEQMLTEFLSERRKIFAVSEETGEIAEDMPVRRNSDLSASVNIMYGCDNFCSYCIVPYVRGRERSREPQNIIDEINALVTDGVQEVLLLGQNVNSYAGGGMDFPQLLDEICTQTGIARLRFMTSHPKDLSDALIDVIARWDAICNHVHLPVQSGSDAVLQAMNRKYSRQEYLNLVEKLRACIPQIAITTDLIVGFPGETDQDFEDTLSLVEQVRFDAAFTFVYSKRTGTKAAQMEHHIPKAVQKERIMRLVALQNAITEQCNIAYEGQVLPVLVESVSTRSERHVCGKADCGKTVNFEGDLSLIGKTVPVCITKGKKTTLFGKRVEE